MSGKLFVIGTGPGSPEQLTPQARAAISVATDFFGYGPYLDRLDLLPDQTRHASDNRQELDRAQAALAMAASGRIVAVVSGGLCVRSASAGIRTWRWAGPSRPYARDSLPGVWTPWS